MGVGHGDGDGRRECAYKGSLPAFMLLSIMGKWLSFSSLKSVVKWFPKIWFFYFYFFACCGYKNQASLMGNFKILPPPAPRVPPSVLAVLGGRKEHRARFLISRKPVGPRGRGPMEPCWGTLGARLAIVISDSEAHEVFAKTGCWGRRAGIRDFLA